MYDNRHWKYDKHLNTKYSMHITHPNDGNVKATLDLQPQVVKVLDFSFDYLNEIRNNRRDTFIVGRLYDKDQYIGSTIAEASKLAKLYAEKCAMFGHNGLVNAFETYNERVFNETDPNTHTLYDEWQFSFYARLKSLGYEGIAFNISSGHGSGGSKPFRWDLYPKTLSTYKYLGFHEYDWPAPMAMYNRGEGNWLSGRYDMSMQEIEKVYGKTSHSVIITEFGATQGTYGGKDIGWKATENTLHPKYGSVPVKLETYLSGVVDYMNFLMKDPRVMGACAFDMGGWGTFEQVPWVTNYFIQNKAWLSSSTNPVSPEPSKKEEDDDYSEVYNRGWEEGYKHGYNAGLKDLATKLSSSYWETLKNSYEGMKK